MVRSCGRKSRFLVNFSGSRDLKYQRAVILSRPYFCISDTPIYPVNYPEELGAIRELGRVHGFSASAPGMPARAHISAPQQSLNEMADATFFAARRAETVFRRTSLCPICGKSSIKAPEIHCSAYHFQHCAAIPRDHGDCDGITRSVVAKYNQA